MAETDLDELSRIDAIVDKLMKDEPEPAPEKAAPAVEPESEAAPVEAEAVEDAAPVEEQASGEEPEAEPALEPAIAPPVSWDSNAKEEFSKLPPAIQRKIAERESEREKFTSTKSQEAAEAKKASEQAQQERLQTLARLKEIEDNALLGDPIIAWGRKADWTQLATQLQPQEYLQHRAAYEQRERALAAIQQERTSLMSKAQSEAVKASRSKLADALGDEFTDDAKWKPLAREIGDYLAEKGVPRESYQGIEDRQIQNFAELLVVVDAVKGRRLTKAAQTLKDKKVAPQVRPAVRPRAVEAAPPVNKPLLTRINRARTTGKDDDKIAALEAAIMNG